MAAEHAALHGGRLSVHDACGGGARFVVEVPVCAPE
jgi:signal transduction histidine kinase